MKSKALAILILTLALLLCACQASGPANDSAAATGSQDTTAPTAKALTAAEAQDIALADAGLTADQVTGLRTEYEVDDGVPEYEVDFRDAEWEYDYTIHAGTGAILSKDKEYDPPIAEPVPTDGIPTEPGAETLTAEEAQAIALAHAELTANQVTGLRTEYEVDDGVPEYSVEFRQGGYEYEYEIHAGTGKILSWDKDRDD